jgi:hypothetical protein
MVEMLELIHQLQEEGVQNGEVAGRWRGEQRSTASRSVRLRRQSRLWRLQNSPGWRFW